MSRSNVPVETVDKSLDIVEYLESYGPAGVTDIATAVGTANSTVHNHLMTLKQRGYVVQTTAGYKLGLRFLRLGESTRTTTDVYEVARPQVEQLVAETTLVGNLAVRQNHRGVYLYRSRGSDEIRFSTTAGEFHELHCTATGKAMLAFESEETRQALLEDIDLSQHTTNTITSTASLIEELGQVREQGVAFDDEEYGHGLRCVGVPIVGPDDRPTGAISVSGPASDLTGEWYTETLPDKLTATANRVELNLRDY